MAINRYGACAALQEVRGGVWEGRLRSHSHRKLHLCLAQPPDAFTRQGFIHPPGSPSVVHGCVAQLQVFPYSVVSNIPSSCDIQVCCVPHSPRGQQPVACAGHWYLSLTSLSTQWPQLVVAVFFLIQNLIVNTWCLHIRLNVMKY